MESSATYACVEPVAILIHAQSGYLLRKGVGGINKIFIDA